MYMLDPERGRRRRALMRDRMVSAGNKTSRVLGSKARHLSNRARGLMCETRSALSSATASLTGNSAGDAMEGNAGGADSM